MSTNCPGPAGDPAGQLPSCTKAPTGFGWRSWVATDLAMIHIGADGPMSIDMVPGLARADLQGMTAVALQQFKDS